MGRRKRAVEPAADARSFSRYLTLGALGVVVPMLIAGALGFYLLSKSSTGFQDAAAESEREVTLANEILRDIAMFDRAAELAIDSGSSVDADLRRLSDEVTVGLEQAQSFDDEDERSTAAQARTQMESAWSILEQIPAAGRVERLRLSDAYERAVSGADALILGLVGLGASELRAQLDAIRAEERRDKIPLWVGLGLGLLLAAFAIRGLSRHVGTPLRRLREGAERLREGQLQHRVEPDGPSEVRRVGAAFNAMAESIQRGQQTLERRASIDPLTGLANRQGLQERYDEVLAAAPPGLEPTMLFLDLDEFKAINDSRGHAFGDEVLRHVSSRLQRALRPACTVARVGGDELAVLIEWSEGASRSADAAAISERVLKIVGAPYAIDGQEMTIGCSIGIAHADRGAGYDKALGDADVAMYAGRERNRGGYAFFRPGLHEVAVNRLDRIEALRSAIEAGDLAVHYQPLVRLQEEGHAGIEALVRWPGPDGSLIPPGDFIPLAEETGLIVPLGRWVLREACRQAMTWTAEGGAAGELIIGVNLSARQLHDPMLIADVESALHDSGLPAERLTLEITETAIMRDVEIAIGRLHELRRLGVWLAIDDFGTGQSSLSYLRRFPVSHLKVAREFVDQVEESPNDVALVKGIVDLARGLGHRVIAEGIETPGQAAILQDLSCDFAQGFYFSRPVPADRLEAALRDAPTLGAPERKLTPQVVEPGPTPRALASRERRPAIGHAEVVRHLPDVTVILFDCELRYRSIEGQALERAGWRPGELIGLTLEEALPPDRAAGLRAILEPVLAGHERDFEFSSSRNDAVFQLWAEPLHDQNGAIMGALMVARDVTASRSSGAPEAAAPVAAGTL